MKLGSASSNALKTYITEKHTATEAKGKEMEAVEQFCCFLFTSNHFPSWIEGGERRYNVIEVGNPQYCAGEAAKVFRSFIGRFRKFLEDDEKLARIYNGLIQHQQSAGFDAKAFDVTEVDTPVMRRLVAHSDQVLVEQLRELILERGLKAIANKDLVNLCADELRIKSTQISHLMGELGWHREKAKWGGRDFSRVVWVQPGCHVDHGKLYLSDGTVEPVTDNEVGDNFELIVAPTPPAKPGDQV